MPPRRRRAGTPAGSRAGSTATTPNGPASALRSSEATIPRRKTCMLSSRKIGTHASYTFCRAIDWCCWSIRATGSESFQTWNLGAMAEAYAEGGQPAEGLNVLAEAIMQMEKTGERLCEPELYRLKAQILSQMGASVSLAEECLHQAIEAARRQQAKSWELRAATTLARRDIPRLRERRIRRALPEKQVELVGFFVR